MFFTDIESSTRLWEHDKEAMGRALGIHDAIMRQSITENLGYEVATEGDAFQVPLLAFSRSFANVGLRQRLYSAALLMHFVALSLRSRAS